MLAIGVMDLCAMALVTALITVERLAPGGEARRAGFGAVLFGLGLFLTARATGLG